MDNISSDLLIHDWLSLGIASGVMYTCEGDALVVLKPSGNTLHIPSQKMWAGMRATQIRGTVILHFYGASRGNPESPAGYGFQITVGEDETNLFILR